MTTVEMDRSITPPRVLVIIGASRSGKSTLAQKLGQDIGWPWMQADDLRIAFEFGGLTDRRYLPEFLRLYPDLSDHYETPTDSADAMCRVAHLMRGPVSTVIKSHVETGSPLIIEGDCIEPSIFSGPPFAEWMRSGVLVAVCLRTPSREDAFLRITSETDAPQNMDDIAIRVSRICDYGAWIETQCRHVGIKVLLNESAHDHIMLRLV